MSQIKHYIRFGSHTETKVLKKVKSHIQGLTFNANVVAHTPSAIYKMIYVNFPNISFFIDPQTYIFQLDPIKYYSVKKKNKTEIKNSVKQLSFKYGDPFIKIQELSSLDHLTFFSSNLDSFTKSVIEFQKNYINEEYQKNKVDDGYDDYDEPETKILSPEFIIPPYFYLNNEDNYDKWLELNINCIKSAIDQFPSDNIIPELILESNLLFDKSKMDSIIHEYKTLEIPSILLWIDNLDETDAGKSTLKKFIDLVKSLEIDVINLYGGGLSLLLSKKNILKGFCHGPGYGESRPIKPVGGGIPNAKYYLSHLMKRIPYEESYRILKSMNVLNNKYFSEVCNCDICKSLIKRPIEKSFYNSYGRYKLSSSGNVSVPTQDTLINNQSHFLSRRFTEINDLNLSDILSIFDQFIQWNSTEKQSSVQHLINWKEILE